VAYPSPSDWTSGAAGSAWWYFTPSSGYTQYQQGSQYVCATTAADLLTDLRGQLSTRLTANQLPSFDGGLATANDVPLVDPTAPNAGWDTGLLRALYAVAQADRVPSQYLVSIQQDASTQTISVNTMAVAIWEAELSHWYATNGADRYGAGSPSDITLPSTVQVPTWATPPSGSLSPGAGFQCTQISAPAVTPIPPPTVVPFQLNEWAVIGVAGAGALALALFGKQVPVRADRTRRNPRRRRRARPAGAS
jgi:hypothetical protein